MKVKWMQSNLQNKRWLANLGANFLLEEIMSYRTTVFLLPAIYLMMIASSLTCAHAMDPRFELDPAALKKNLPPKAVAAPVPESAAKTAAPTATKGEAAYTVKKGDTLTKILIRDFGMSRKRARAIVPEIKRRNQLNGSGRLKAGDQIVIPLLAKGEKRRQKPARGPKMKRGTGGESGSTIHSLSLFRSSPEISGDVIGEARLVWNKLLPGKVTGKEPYAIRGKSFSLDLDPKRFPVFPAASGGKILVEAGGKLSPLVRSLIEQNDPGTRFVSYSPGNKRRFFADILAAAGFYSVEEDFSVSFGSDPKLTVTTDFKVENDPDSPLEHDIFLFNTSTRRGSFPPVLTEYMAGQGFRILDTSVDGKGRERRKTGVIGIMTETEPSAVADMLLSALNLRYERNREVSLLSLGDDGVGLRVKADRYFEKNGEKYVVSVFRGDPENYTLLRILESMHYRVVMLNPDENARSVTTKLLTQLHLPGQYAMQEMLPDSDLPYSIRMSGIIVNSPANPGKLFLTETRPDPVITELLQLNGYSIRDSKDELVRK